MSDGVWDQWLRLQRRCLQLAAKKEYSRAQEEVNRFLEAEGSSELRGEVLAFRGMLKESEERLEEAKADFLAARALSTPATYQKYTLELSLARLCEQLGSLKEATAWYVEALETVAADPLTSGSAAISGLLRQKGEAGLNSSERLLCEKAALQAWKLFSLPGRPDLQNLPEIVRLLKEASSRPLPAPR